MYALFFFIFPTLTKFVFLNEEFLIAIFISIVFFIIVNSVRKSINLFLFSKVTVIYFSFLKLIVLNIKLINKMLDLLSLDLLRLEAGLIFQLYTSFSVFFNKVIDLFKITHLSFYKNFVLYFIKAFDILQFFLSSANSEKDILNNFTSFELLVENINSSQKQEIINNEKTKLDENLDLLGDYND